jgi:putative ABC transport system permease protein
MLVGDRLKYFALVAGLAFAALLVTQQSAIFTGYALQTSAWIRDTGQADLWVTDPQVEQADDIKPISDTAILRVRGVPGVEWAVPMYKSFLKARLEDGTLQTVRLIGLDDATLIGGPPTMVEGTLDTLRQDRAVIIDVADTTKSLQLRRSDNRPMRVGDRLSINDHEVIVAGTFTKTPEFFWEPAIYTTYSRALAIAPPERRALTYVLAKVKPGADTLEVARNIEAVTGLKARTNDQFAADTMNWLLVKTGILINFGITIGLGFLIGVLVAALLLYTFILENLRYFAALKAMGATNGRIIGMVAVQVAVVGTLGYGLGAGAAALFGTFLAGGDTGLAFSMPWPIPVFAAVAILACCLFAGLVSLHRVLSLEPAVVFKA